MILYDLIYELQLLLMMIFSVFDFLITVSNHIMFSYGNLAYDDQFENISRLKFS